MEKIIGIEKHIGKVRKIPLNFSASCLQKKKNLHIFNFSELVEECWEEIKEPSYFDMIYTFYPSGKIVKKYTKTT